MSNSCGQHILSLYDIPLPEITQEAFFKSLVRDTGDAVKFVVIEPILPPPPRGKPPTKTTTGSFPWRQGLKWVTKFQEEHPLAAAYFTVGMSNASRDRKVADMLHPRALFLDGDDPEQSQALLDFWMASPSPPNVVVRTSPGKIQLYWFVTADLDWEKWDLYQQMLIDFSIAKVGPGAVDTSIKDRPRVLRVPGSWHCKVKEGVEGPRTKGAILWLVAGELGLEDLAMMFADMPRPVQKPPRKLGAQLIPPGTYDAKFQALAEKLEILEERDDLYVVECPNAAEHTMEGGETHLYLPSERNGHVGGFRCLHSHCAERFGANQIGFLYTWMEQGAPEDMSKVQKGRACPAAALEAFDDCAGLVDEPVLPPMATAVDAAGEEVQEPVIEPSPSAGDSFLAPGGPFSRLRPGSFIHDGKPVADSLAAEELVSLLRDRFAYCPKIKQWYAWTGCYWTLDLGETLLEDDVMRLMRLGGLSEVGYKGHYLSSVLGVMRRGTQMAFPTPAGETADYMPFSNGVLDLRTMALQAPAPANGNIWALPHAYDPSADCPNTKAWLLEAMGGDYGKVEHLRAVMAVVIGRAKGVKAFFDVFGPKNTGKSTFSELLAALVGPGNVHSSDMESLTGTNGAARFEMSAVWGKQVIFLNDADAYNGSVGKIKQLTSGGKDLVRMEFKGKGVGHFPYTGAVVRFANSRLTTSDNSSAWLTRHKTIEFSRVFSTGEQAAWRARGGEKVLLHSEIPGILNWLLALTPAEIQHRIDNPPRTSLQAIFEGHLEGNKVLAWMIECCVPDDTTAGIGNVDPVLKNGRKHHANPKADLLPSFLNFCLAHGKRGMEKNAFRDAVIDLASTMGYPVERKRVPGGRNTAGLHGIRLRTAEERRFDWSGVATEENLQAGEIESLHAENYEEEFRDVSDAAQGASSRDIPPKLH